MKKFKLLLLLPALLLSMPSFSQDDEFTKYLESAKKKLEQKSEEKSQYYKDRNEEYSEYVAKRNAEFAEFVAKRWEL